MTNASSTAPSRHRRTAVLVLEILINFVAPWAIYHCSEASLGEVNALLASSAPPIAWSIIEFIRVRRIDAVSMLVLAGIVLSLLAFVGGGSVKFLQLREKAVTALIGLIFLGSAVIGRPLMYQLARAAIGRRSQTELAAFDGLGRNQRMRRVMMIMTLVWGFGLTAEAALASVLVLTLSVSDYLIVGPIMGYATMGGLTLWTFWYSNRQRRKGSAGKAAAAAKTD